MGTRFNKEEFVRKARERHGTKYDYSLVVGVGKRKKEKIICPIHGVFEQVRSDHLRTGGCNKCGNEKHINRLRKTTEEFVKEATEKHGGFYDYSKVEYFNSLTKVCIICPIHGEFWQRPNQHLSRLEGCPQCGLERCATVGVREERFFQPWLAGIFPTVKFQHVFDGLPYIVDAYIPDLELVIEYDERGHFHKTNIAKDRERQHIIEDMHSVSFYRIKDKDFLDKKNEHESRLLSF